MSSYRLWLGNGDHPDFKSPKCKCNPGCVAFFPVEEAKESAPKGAEFVAAIATSPRPGCDVRDGYFIGPSPKRSWKWVLWKFTYDDNWECWSWEVCASTDEPLESSKKAAASLLAAFWAWERDKWGETLFEQVEASCLIAEREVWKIGRKSFGQKASV